MIPAPSRILVIDDATVVRLYYRHLLEAEGYDVEEAINGVEALEKVLTRPYDLCVVDVNMPLMDGYGFLEQLRQQPRTQAMPALVTTTQDAPRDLTLAMQAGATDFLVKPVDADFFMRRVADLLRPQA